MLRLQKTWHIRKVSRQCVAESQKENFLTLYVLKRLSGAIPQKGKTIIQYKSEVKTMYEDKTLVCKECGNEFVFTAGEQEFYAEKVS